MGFLFSKHKECDKNSITRIDDLHWIVDGKFVNLDPDSELNKCRQRIEDLSLYNQYVFERTAEDYDEIIKDLWAIKRYIQSGQISSILDLPDNWANQYGQYVYKCWKLDVFLYMSKEEFQVMLRNPFICGLHLSKCYGNGIYTIYHDGTAQWKDGERTMRRRFEKEWY